MEKSSNLQEYLLQERKFKNKIRTKEKMQKREKIKKENKNSKLSIVVNIVLIFVLIAIFIRLKIPPKMIYITVPANFSYYSLPNQNDVKFTTALFDASNGSMLECISEGDVGVWTEADKFKLRQGDIIAYKNGRDYITHRIIRINSDGTIIVKGDANRFAEEINIKDIDWVLAELIFPLQKKDVV